MLDLCRPAQWAEETKRADRTVPWAIMISIVGTSILGLAYMISILFCIEASHPCAHLDQDVVSSVWAVLWYSFGILPVHTSSCQKSQILYSFSI